MGHWGTRRISIDVNGQNVTFATAIQGTGTSLTLTNSAGSGGLTLPANNTYTGATTNNGGTLTVSGSIAGNVVVNSGGKVVLNGSGSLSASSSVSIGAGGTFDVSALSSPYEFGGSATLKASGNGTNLGTSAATIVPASGGIFDLGGSQPVTVTWGGGSSGVDSNHPALVVTQGTLNFNNNTITVVVPGTALGVGTYTLITAAAITGTPNTVPSFTGGNGLALGSIGAISVTNSAVVLTVGLSGGSGTWTNDVDSGWSVATNWSGNPNFPNLPGDLATLGVGSALRTVTLDTNISLGYIQFTNSNSFVVANGGNTLTFDNKGGGAVASVGGGTSNAVNAAVALNDNTTVTVGGGESLAFGGTIGNSVGTATNLVLTFNGAGTNIVSGVNTYGPSSGTVGTILSGGVLELGNNGALGAGDLSNTASSTLLAGAALGGVNNNIGIGAGTTTVNNNGNNVTLNGVISGGGKLTKTGAGTLTLGNNRHLHRHHDSQQWICGHLGGRGLRRKS